MTNLSRWQISLLRSIEHDGFLLENLNVVNQTQIASLLRRELIRKVGDQLYLTELGIEVLANYVKGEPLLRKNTDRPISKSVENLLKLVRFHATRDKKTKRAG